MNSCYRSHLQPHRIDGRFYSKTENTYGNENGSASYTLFDRLLGTLLRCHGAGGDACSSRYGFLRTLQQYCHHLSVTTPPLDVHHGRLLRGVKSCSRVQNPEIVYAKFCVCSCSDKPPSHYCRPLSRSWHLRYGKYSVYADWADQNGLCGARVLFVRRRKCRAH